MSRCPKLKDVGKSAYRHEDFTLAMTKWITIAGLPFDTLENHSLRAALKILNANVQLVGRSQATRNVFELHKALIREAKAEIEVGQLDD